MKLKFYGTRGSIPICEPNFQQFGGNTTCVAIFGSQPNDKVLVIDAGTGIRNLNKDLMKMNLLPDQEIVVLFTHFHWDHIQGFPFFDIAYEPDRNIHLYSFGENFTADHLKSILAHQMGEVYFPVSLDKMSSIRTIDAADIHEAPFDRGRLRINHHDHPGGAIGYRVDIDDSSVYFCTDISHGETLDPNVIEMARDVDVLIHEAQYTPEELKMYPKRGHSSWEQAIEVAERSGAKKLYLTHHDPDHDDDFLLEVEEQCQKRFSNCYLAREGVEVEF